MDAKRLEAVYRAYIDALNERRFDDLSHFVHDELAYNHRPLTRLDYRDMIAGDVASIPDLRFTIDLIVVRDDLVACRLAFECTPTGEIFGLQPTGRSVTFAEHVFYRFRDGRIAEVWSLIDTPAIAAQLAGEQEGDGD